MNSRYAKAGAALVLVSLAACKKDKPVEPGGTPASIEVVTAAPATGAVNSVVSPIPSFVVKNDSGQAIAAAVTVTVSAGGGSITSNPTTSVAGPTGIGNWKLGQLVGANTVTVTVAGLDPLVFTVPTTTPLAPKSIVEVGAVARTALANTVATPDVVVAVRDTFGNSISGQSVTFAIQMGGGSLIGTATGTTNSSGQITAPQWRLGKSANGSFNQKLRATSGSLIPLDVSATVQTNYTVTVRFFGSTTPTTNQQAAFTGAAQRIAGFITGDVANVQVSPSTDLSSCAEGQSLSETIDDIIIFAEVKNIDGPGNILGQARPCFTRTTSANCGVGCANIPVIGVMSFDSADLLTIENRGQLEIVITHEMLHVIGVGSMWGTFGLRSGGGTADPRYEGAEGIAGCKAVGGTITCASTVPVHNLDGPGSADTHWRESTFLTELMTASVTQFQTTAPISVMTVRSLADFGYTVNAQNFDDYTIPGGSLIAGGSSMRSVGAAPSAPWEVVGYPLYSIDIKTGEVRPLKPRP